MNILYIAYSCAPNKGSEEKIGWNIPLESAKTNNVYVITKEEHKKVITEYLREHNVENIKFYYVDIPAMYKTVKSVYTFRLNKWHKTAFKLAKEICAEKNIDIIHQITPIEFRSIGDYGKIKGPKFVCGPIGGGEYIPKGLTTYAKRFFLIEWLRRILNCLCKVNVKFTKKLSKCDYILFANSETEQYLKQITEGVRTEIYFDNGLSVEEFSKSQRTMESTRQLTIIVAGRLAYRKGHAFLFDALKKMPSNVKYCVKIVGNGPELKILKKKVDLYGLQDKVVFLGRIPFSAMQNEYENADVFVMPSIRETTGSVLLEAASKAIPVITINKFGGPVLFDESSSWLYDGKNKREYINNLAVALEDCIKNPQKRIEKGKKAQIVALNHTWDKKIEKYNSIYKKLISNDD